MPRPDQHEYRRKRAYPREDDSDSEDGRTSGHGKARVLPVGVVPEGWEGEAEDGEMYLAMTV